MSMYGLALLPLMRMLEDTEITQKWYADDGNAVGEARRNIEALQETATTWTCFWIPHHEMPPSFQYRSQSGNDLI